MGYYCRSGEPPAAAAAAPGAAPDAPSAACRAAAAAAAAGGPGLGPTGAGNPRDWRSCHWQLLGENPHEARRDLWAGGAGALRARAAALRVGAAALEWLQVLAERVGGVVGEGSDPAGGLGRP